MGKHKHSKDKLYIVASEYSRDWGGHKEKAENKFFKCLPFYCCALSLTPFETPVCTLDGIIYEYKYIVPYIQKYKRNPVDGKKLSISDLTALKFYKNKEDKYCCPITFKVFTDHTHIVANKKTGNVYAYEAIDNLCKKTKNWIDLLTGEPFSSRDLICIQNPQDFSKRQIKLFHHFNNKEEISVPLVEKSESYIEATDFMNKVFQQKDQIEEKKKEHNKLFPTIAKEESSHKDDEIKHTLYTTHYQAAGFTSTIVTSNNKIEFRNCTEDEMNEVLYQRVKKAKKKGYVKIITTYGNLNIELHCNLVPIACHNFLMHCENNYYNNTIFYRCIANFMIQGGDPTNTGKGGESAFYIKNNKNEKTFKDEFNEKLSHKGIGVVSMANKGIKNSNTSQFFITFKSCEHLDNHHTIFGKVVGGLDILKALEKLEVDKNYKPKNPPKICEIVVYVNPFDEAKKEIENEKIESKRKQDTKESWLSKQNPFDVTSHYSLKESSEIGKYMKHEKIPQKESKKFKMQKETEINQKEDDLAFDEFNRLSSDAKKRKFNEN